ncbi:lactate utilization protein C [Streptomyces sp. NPDC090025]|uniref:LutC/YkgG family protein n=1 Tax=Streptomyces sp. NPDC090025 TaxID=3365922 RepID=UPI0038394331
MTAPSPVPPPAPPPPSSRERILARIRAAVADAPEVPELTDQDRRYRRRHAPDDPAALVGLLHENLADYRAVVHRTTPAGLPALVGRLLAGHGARRVAVPPGLPDAWLATAVADGVELVADSGDLTARQLDVVEAVVTGCALAIAETGTLVLDGGPAQGRRALTLVPDLHVCVVRVPDQVVASVPLALPLLDPRRPLTWISGPSATSDIELDRVEGVHGPRRLEVILVEHGPDAEPDERPGPGAGGGHTGSSGSPV